MVLELPGGLFGQDDVRETPTGTLAANDAVPIGCILPWLKTLAGTPTLPAGYVECDGSVLNDANSVYNGVTLPDLNGGEFVRGATTSGGTGGSSTHTHISPLAEYPGGSFVSWDNSFGTSGTVNSGRISVDTSAGTCNRLLTSSTSTNPLYYNVVWIIRIK